MLDERILKTIQKYNLIESKDKIIVAVSGGADSMCLLLILNQLSKLLNFEILVCHVNHGLRKNANLDEEFVKDYCEENNIKYYIRNVNIKRSCAGEQDWVRRSPEEKRDIIFLLKYWRKQRLLKLL